MRFHLLHISGISLPQLSSYEISLDHFMGLDTSVLLRAEVSGRKGDRKEAKRRQEDIDERV